MTIGLLQLNAGYTPAPPPTGGLTIVLFTTAAWNANPNVTAFNACAANVKSYFESLFSTITNNVTFNWQLDYSVLGAGSDAATGVTYVSSTPSYATIYNALMGMGSPGSSSLPGSSPFGSASLILMANALAKAMGLTSIVTAGLDAHTTFNSNIAWNTSIPPTPVNSGYDLVGVMKHECTEGMGRQSYNNLLPNYFVPLDLFRYASAGVRTSGGSPDGSKAHQYFSLDGSTLLGTWNNDNLNGDFMDWYPSGPIAFDCCNDYVNPNDSYSWSSVDTQCMQAIGWY